MDRSTSDDFCCGMRLYGSFHNAHFVKGKFVIKSHEDKVAQIKKTVAKNYGGYATLTTSQLTKNGWEKALEECGWSEAGSFVNPNSGYKVHIWVYAPGKKTKTVKKES